MTRAEFDEWLPRNIAGYAENIAASGAMPAAAAREKAERDTARSFSAGFEAPGQHVFRLLAGDVAVGWLGFYLEQAFDKRIKLRHRRFRCGNLSKNVR